MKSDMKPPQRQHPQKRAVSRLDYSPLFLTLVPALLAASMVLTGCARKKGDPRSGFAVPVLAETATVMDVPVELRQIGTVEAIKSVSITARVGGQILSVGFKDGQNVEKGDMLFIIDPAPYKAALAQAQATLARDEAALLNANADMMRYEALVGKDYVTKQAYDAAVSAAAEAGALVKADSAIVNTARLNVSYCTIVAPIAGRTGAILINRGNLVVANAATPLVTINQIQPIYIRFTVPEAGLNEVRTRRRTDSLEVWAFIPPDSTSAFRGKLTFVDNSVDQSTGTILLKATFTNENRSLWPGQYVRVGLVLSIHRGATVIPAAAVQTSQQGDFVYVATPGDTAQFRPVVQGTGFGRWVVIDKGVAPGEKIVTDGQLALRQGTRITVKPSAGGEQNK